jgi:hypothetical protein
MPKKRLGKHDKCQIVTLPEIAHIRSLSTPTTQPRVCLPTHTVPTLVLVAWALLLAAWVMGNAPFAAPDEADHYVRAIGISEGHWIGKADPGARLGVRPTEIAWTAQEARIVSLPQDLDPVPFTCELAPGRRNAACLNVSRPTPTAVTRVTAVGDYQPLPYLLPAVILRAGSSPPAVLRLGRAAEAVSTLGLLAIAVFALYDAGSSLLSLLGLLLAVTPMVLFCGASLNGSATEIAGATAFFSCLLRLGRPRPAPARWWVLTALSGAIFALSRSASPVWLALMLLIALGWVGPKAFVNGWAGGGWVSRVTAGVLVLAVTLNRVWEWFYGAYVSPETTRLHAGLVAGAHEWWRALPELVGRFGYLDVKLPLSVLLVWFALVLALLAVAGAGCKRRERVVLAIVLVVGLVGPVVFYALFIRPTGGGLQGRHVLPVLVAIPLLAGDALNRHREHLGAALRWFLTITIPVAVAVMQATAWYVNAKYYAVGGSGPGWFLSRAAWAPPAGWWTWLVAAVLAGVCLAAVSLGDREPTSALGADHL